MNLPARTAIPKAGSSSTPQGVWLERRKPLRTLPSNSR
jgi:hypothetical protein